MHAAIAVLVLCMASCSSQRRLSVLTVDSSRAGLSLPEETAMLPMEELNETNENDTIQVQDFDGRQVLIMKAIKDESGEMVATDVITPARVTARFRHVAERLGRVDIAFRITVPESIQYDDWQLRFYPDMIVLEDTVSLDPVFITGTAYRKAQLRGYQRYERFLRSIIDDTTVFINMNLLEIFIRRNLPDIYAFRSDTTYVSEEKFRSAFGVTEDEAVRHYTNKLRMIANERRKARRGKMFSKFVRTPILTDGLRLDTVIRESNGDMTYDYVQTVNTCPGLRKVDILLKGKIYKEDKCIYLMPQPDPLTFYISSLSALTDNTKKYLTKIIERKVEANTACYIDFSAGSADVDRDFGNNRTEMTRIMDNLASLIENREFDLDSVVVTAYASPEGGRDMNEALARRRANSISLFFGEWIDHYRDSLDRSAGFMIDENGNSSVIRTSAVSMTSRSGGENWRMLDALVRTDTCMTETEKEAYFRCRDIRGEDERENRIKSLGCYRHLRQSLYPRLRTVKFDFHLHRKGMVKDTVHTTTIDSAYMAGVQAIRDREYKKAVSLLRPYKDYNTAVAYMCMDYNASALSILRALKGDYRVDYLLAVLYARLGEVKLAVKHYVSSCMQNRAMIHRGNLDPEISELKKKYGIDKQLGYEE